MALLHLAFLVSPQITRGGKPVTRFGSDKALALLAYLAVEADRPHRRDALIGIFFPEYPATTARHNLSQTLLRLRHAIDDDDTTRFLEITTQTIQFNAASDCWVDAHEFLRLLRECETHPHRRIEACAACIARLERAGALYQREFLAHFFLDDCPAFEEWLLVQREHFRRRALTALGHVTTYYEEQGEAGYAETLRAARRLVELEAWREEPYRVLMRTYAAMNQVDAALAEYQTLANLLHQDLGLEPSAETTALYKHLRNTSESRIANRESPTPSLHPPLSTLPLPSTPLVGRATELAQLAEKIGRTDCRLLTLLGQGGIGKTRLAIQTARDNRAAFPRGVYFVDLADTVAPEMIPTVMADALQFHFQGAKSTAQQIMEHLREVNQPLLLVLDNFEQIINGAQFVSELLQRAPNVTLLVTSRERLNVQGEWLFEVEGLRAPTTLPTQLPDDWDAPEAVQLLLQCVARANVNAQLWREEEKRAALIITQLVEGMPLAIELAAAWARTLTPIEIAAEIARSLDIFASTRRDVPKRHASIRAVFEHSWRLLSAQEKIVFAGMSVFRGGMTRDAAREIAGASLQHLAGLVEKSLLKRTAAGRYRLHELVRQFAAEKLVELNEDASTQKQHANYFLNLLVERGDGLNSERARDSMAELLREGENVRAAWQWAVAHHDTDALRRGLPALANFYSVAGLVQEGEPLLRATLTALSVVIARHEAISDAASKENAASVSPRAVEIALSTVIARHEAISNSAEEIASSQRALLAMTDAALVSEIYAQLANFSFRLANYPDTIAAAHAAIEWGRAAGVIASQVMGEWLLGAAVERNTRDPAGAARLENALTLARAAELPILQAQILYTLGERAYFQYAFPNAQSELTRALELAEQHNDHRLTSDILTLLAGSAYSQGDAARSHELLQRALPLKRMLGDPHGEARIYITLGNVALLSYQLDRGLEWYHQAATLAREIGDQNGWFRATANHAGVQLVLGEFDAARAEYQELLTRARQLQESWSTYKALQFLALLENAVGESERALSYALEYAELTMGANDAHELAAAWERIADVYLARGDVVQAEPLYRRALQVYQDKQDHDYALCCQAGLAQLALARGDTAEALQWANALRQGLTEQLPYLFAEPLRLYLTCYQVLRACGAENAAEVLRHAHILLQKNAAAIGDARVRASYLQKIRWHREIVAVWNETAPLFAK